MKKNFISMCYSNPSILLDTILTVDDFKDQKDIAIFSAMKNIIMGDGVLDAISLNKKGIAYEDIARLDQSMITTNWRYREKQIIEANQRATLKNLCSQILADNDTPTNELLDKLQDSGADLSNRNGEPTIHVRDVLKIVFEQIEERANHNGRIIGVKTGYETLDKAFLGFRAGKLYYIGARPSQGKTALMLNIAMKTDVPVGIFSVESAKEEITHRMISIETGIPLDRLSAGQFHGGEFEKFTKAYDKITNKDIHIQPESAISIDDIVRISKNMVQKKGVKLIMVDYLQLISNSSTRKFNSFREAMMYQSKMLKHIARILNVPVVATAQLGRTASTDRPEMHHFSETGQIEQDADGAILIYNKKVDDREETRLIIGKNRDGATGDFMFEFKRFCLQFNELPQRYN